MVLAIALAASLTAPAEPGAPEAICLATGFCAAPSAPSLPPGLMYLALGLVGGGVALLRAGSTPRGTH
jgi:hypothetical protein